MELDGVEFSLEIQKEPVSKGVTRRMEEKVQKDHAPREKRIKKPKKTHRKSSTFQTNNV